MKECFFRHGNFKLKKIVEYQYEGKYKVKRFTAIMECGDCGIITFNSNIDTD